jgi:ribosome-binding factor A
MGERKEKIEHAIKKLAAEFLERESDKTSLITVTHADVSPDFSNAKIFISVLPESKEEHALFFCKRKMTDFKRYAMKYMHMKSIPFFDVVLDLGEKNRQRIEELGIESKIV